MAFEFGKKFFSRPQAEQGEQPADMFGTLDGATRATLDEIKYDYKQTDGFTREHIAFLSGVREKLQATYGEEAYIEALSAYMKSETPSRLAELREKVERNTFLKQTLMRAMADFERVQTPETTTALERAKGALKVLTQDTFSRFDVEAYCAELVTSQEFETFKKAQDEAVITRVANAAGAPDVQKEAFAIPHPGDAPRHIASEDSIHPADSTVIDWVPPTEKYQPGKPERKTL